MHENYTMVSVKKPLLEAAAEAYSARHRSLFPTRAEVVRTALRCYLERDETEDYDA